MNRRRFSTLGRASRSPNSTTLGSPTLSGLTYTERTRSSSVILMRTDGLDLPSSKLREGGLFDLKSPEKQGVLGEKKVWHIGGTLGTEKSTNGDGIYAMTSFNASNSDELHVNLANRRDHETKGNSAPQISSLPPSPPGNVIHLAKQSYFHAILATTYVWIVSQLTWVVLLQYIGVRSQIEEGSEGPIEFQSFYRGELKQVSIIGREHPHQNNGHNSNSISQQPSPRGFASLVANVFITKRTYCFHTKCTSSTE